MRSSDNGGAHVFRRSLKIQKTELRGIYLAKRNAIPEEQKKALDAAICRKIIGSVSYRYADVLLVYAPLSGEIDISAVTETALRDGKRVAFPRCVPGTPTMNFHLVSELDSLSRGSYSIQEPPQDAPVWLPEGAENAVCIIPGVLFDRRGHRIGYGKGYYDRYLSDKSITRLGVVYNDFLLDSIPTGRFDLAADVIVTEKQMLTVRK